MLTDANEVSGRDLGIGRVKLATRIPERLLNQGLYRVEFMAGLHSLAWLSMPGESSYAVFFRIEGGLSDSVFWIERRPGMVAPDEGALGRERSAVFRHDQAQAGLKLKNAEGAEVVTPCRRAFSATGATRRTAH